MSKGRMEAFSDGVIAIIITIIVLLFDLPEGDDLRSLTAMGPLVACYAVSFILIGMRWANHHHLLQVTQNVNGKIIWANLLYLFTISLFPVSIGWVSKTGFGALPTTVFAAVNLIETLAFVLLEHTIFSAHDCVLLKSAVTESRKELVTLLLEVAAVAVSLIKPVRLLAYPLLVVMSCMWIIPDLRMERVYDAALRDEV